MIEETIYDRQNLIEDLKIPEVVTIIGLGGTGFWTAIFLAMSGVKELILIDSDRVEASNLNRLPLMKRDIGKEKVLVVKNYIEQIRDNCRIETHIFKIENSTNCSLIRGTVFCCTDNLTSQQLICAYSKANNLPYQRIGYDGTILNISEAFPLSFEKEETQTGYTVTPSWVIPAVFSAAAGVCSKLYKKLHIMDDIGKIHILNCSNIPDKIRDEIGYEAAEEREDRIKDNIHDYIPDNYRNCEDCNYIDPDNGDYGYCADCDKEYTQSEIDEQEEKAKNEEYTDILEQIENDNIDTPGLKNAIYTYVKLKTDFEIKTESRKDYIKGALETIIKDIYLTIDTGAAKNFYGIKIIERTKQIMDLITAGVKAEINEVKIEENK